MMPATSVNCKCNLAYARQDSLSSSLTVPPMMVVGARGPARVSEHSKEQEMLVGKGEKKRLDELPPEMAKKQLSM